MKRPASCAAVAAAFILAIFLLPARALAALNPVTGDPSVRIMGWVFLALGVSLIVIIILFLLSAKNRRD
ncbi:MAG: hypothetical protein LBU86_01855 [Oscillospiraceae bacterium]|jgi:hypothetical protein|nr:hypothetical protein [Oscillospiraceae bacterium]